MAIAIIPISTLQQYFLDKHSIPKEEQKRLFVSVLRAFDRADLARETRGLLRVASGHVATVREAGRAVGRGRLTAGDHQEGDQQQRDREDRGDDLGRRGSHVGHSS